MKTFVSVLLPTRKRKDRLFRCINSILENASRPVEVQMCIRIHSDDMETLELIPTLICTCPNLTVVVGHSMRGYTDLSRFYQDCAAVAVGEWVWVMNDDVTIEGKGWDDMLAQEKPHVIIMPEFHKLGNSVYFRDSQNPFMFIPNKAWETYGIRYFEDPFDAALWKLFERQGWPFRFLNGITAWHNRTNTDTILEERRY